MLMIAICDDDTAIGASLERSLMNIMDNISAGYKIEVFFTGEALVKAMAQGTHYDLIFLDIEFAKNQINGVEVGRLIRDKQNNYMVSIVYMSRVKSYAYDLFDLQPFNFLVKPLNDEKIDAVIRKYMKVSGLWAAVFTYKIGHEVFKVQIKDIMYIESYNKKLILHHANGSQEEFYGAIKNVWETQLERFDFLFIHTSYIVNYDYITAFKVNQVTLVSSVTPLPVSKHRLDDVRTKYYEIMKRRRAE